MAKAELAAKVDLTDLQAYWPDWEDEETDERLFDIKIKWKAYNFTKRIFYYYMLNINLLEKLVLLLAYQ